MPTKRVRDNERRRCPKACSTCKRRKERCDGRQPCGRCITRRVERTCWFDTSGSTRGRSHTPERAATGRITYDDSQSGGSPHGSGTGSLHMSYSDQQQPLSSRSSEQEGVSTSLGLSSIHQLKLPSGTAIVPSQSRLLGDGRVGGRLTFIGDSANLAFLKVIRRIVQDRLGSCAFTDDPLRHMMVDATPKWAEAGGRLGSLAALASAMASQTPPRLSREEAHELLKYFCVAVNSVLDLFDEGELAADLDAWLEHYNNHSTEPHPDGKLFYMILAIGAQSGPHDQDDLAEGYYTAGSHLAIAEGALDEASYSTVRLSILSTVWQLNGSRRNSAFMHLGIALRAASALGIHRRDLLSRNDHEMFTPHEQRTRERLWTALRMLDIFVSASLGRPLATSETLETGMEVGDQGGGRVDGKHGGGGASENEDRSYAAAMLDICAILETVLNDVYAKRMVSVEILERVSVRHRRWADRLALLDRPPPAAVGDELSHHNPIAAPDAAEYARFRRQFRLCILKQLYYWSIILLTRPFLTDLVSRSRPSPGEHQQPSRRERVPPQAPRRSASPAPPAPTSSVHLLVHACIDSAIHTVEVIHALMAPCLSDNPPPSPPPLMPKRMPFVVNSLFISALVLALGIFGHLDRSSHQHDGSSKTGNDPTYLPLEKSLAEVQQLLHVLSSHDLVARRKLAIVTHLREACDSFAERRARKAVERQGILVRDLFGSVHQHLQQKNGPPTATAATAGEPSAAHESGTGQQDMAAPGQVDRSSSMDAGRAGAISTPTASSTSVPIHELIHTPSNSAPNSGMGVCEPSPATTATPAMDGSNVIVDFMTPPVSTESLLLTASPRTLLFDESTGGSEEFPFFPTMDGSTDFYMSGTAGPPLPHHNLGGYHFNTFGGAHDMAVFGAGSGSVLT